MTDEVRILQGSRIYVSTATPATEDAAGYNATAFTAGAARYMLASNLLNYNISTGASVDIPTSEPMDRTIVRKAKRLLVDPGQVTLMFEKEDDDAGQGVLNTLFGTTALVAVKFVFQGTLNTHSVNDNAVYHRGYVSERNPFEGGDGSAWAQVQYVVNMVTMPFSVDNTS